MKTERVSYDVITPSAARGLLEAIFWHPGMRWIIDRIYICKPIKFFNLRRNELTDKISARNVQNAMKCSNNELYLVSGDKIVQRAAMLLQDVAYVLEAHFEMTDQTSPSDNPGKFQDISKRRIERGQFYHKPYLGCREFPAHFAPCPEPPACPEELLGERDLGYMLWDMDYTDPQNIRPLFFRATLHNGVLQVPPPNSEEVRG